MKKLIYESPRSTELSIVCEASLLLCSNGCAVDSSEEGDPEVGQLSNGRGWSAEDWGE